MPGGRSSVTGGASTALPLPDQPFGEGAAATLTDLFRDNYQRFFGRAIDGLGDLEIEIVTWSVKATDDRVAAARHEITEDGTAVRPTAARSVFDPAAGSRQTYAIIERDALSGSERVTGPAVIVERETSTVVTAPFDAVVQSDGTILLIRKGAQA